ncbi:TPA: MFS transporter [Serratia marcescens]
MQQRQRWFGVIALLFLIVIAYADRVNIAVMLVNPDFLQHFQLGGDRAHQGTLMTVFLLGYGVSAMLLTPFLETLMGYRRALTLSVVLWALLTAASPLAGSLLLLCAVRALLGVSEGPLFSLKTMYISDHFAADERGKPNAVSALGVSLGLVIGFPLVSFLMAHFGWAMSFHLLALLNLLLGLALVRLFVHPLALPSSSRPADPQPVLSRVWHTFALAWRTPMLGWILLIEIATLSYLWGSSAWLPAYLTDEKGFSIKQMGWMAALPFIVSIASKYLGGVLLDRIRPYQAPLIFVFGGAAIPTLLQHYARPEAVGSAYGLINGIGNLFSAFVPMAMGMVMASEGKVSSGFAVLIASQLLTLLAGGALFGRMLLARQMKRA